MRSDEENTQSQSPNMDVSMEAGLKVAALIKKNAGQLALTGRDRTERQRHTVCQFSSSWLPEVALAGMIMLRLDSFFLFLEGRGGVVCLSSDATTGSSVAHTRDLACTLQSLQPHVVRHSHKP